MVGFVASLFIGKYPLTITGILTDTGIQREVFISLRLARALVGLVGGFSLGISGYIFQTVLKNPLASPDVVGIASGASVGAAIGILYFSSSFFTGFFSFAGALVCVLLVLFIASKDRSGSNMTLVLSGIAIHSLAQTALMVLKLTADPQRQLSSIEYWLMGSLNGVTMKQIPFSILICAVCISVAVLLHRNIILMANSDDEIRMLGINVRTSRSLILILATVLVSSTISLTGLISFVGLLAPHIARKLFKGNQKTTLLASGITGGVILLVADILARSVSTVELPVSIFTSLLGAPFLLYMVFERKTRL